MHEVVFTSGTTGEPKGVMHALNTVLSTIYPVIDRLAFSERDVILMASTLGHQTGYLYGFCLNLLLGARAVWLDPDAERQRLLDLLVACPAAEMEAFPVSTRVGNPANDDAGLIEPIA